MAAAGTACSSDEGEAADGDTSGTGDGDSVVAGDGDAGTTGDGDTVATGGASGDGDAAGTGGWVDDYGDPMGGATSTGGTTSGFPADTSNPLGISTNGNVKGEDNDWGLRGSWFTVDDGHTEDLVPQMGYPNSQGVMCMSGTAAQVIDMDYGEYWGSRSVFQPNTYSNDPEPGNTVDTLGNLATADEIIGFSFTISGDVIPPTLRFEVLFTDPTDPKDAEADPVNRDNIETLQWRVPTNVNSPTPFDFCISGLAPIVAQ
jgi:hypothetical protein